MAKKIVITIDYETWHPIPKGMRIDWDEDIFRPASKFLEIAKEVGCKLTFMVEMGEYYWLKKNRPGTSRKMERQLKEIVSGGHDVQLHLHPNWLPALGAKYDSSSGWWWDWSKAKLNDYPGDANTLIKKCKSDLESLVSAKGHVVAFRAGAYMVQPFNRVYEALISAKILADTSVYRGGVSKERGYDFSRACSSNQPYWANSGDPARCSEERKLLEFPVFSSRYGERWMMDGPEGKQIFSKLSGYLVEEKGKQNGKTKHALAGAIPEGIKKFFLPKYVDECRLPLEDEYYVMIGHTKGVHDFGAIKENLGKIFVQGDVRSMALGDAVSEVYERCG